MNLLAVFDLDGTLTETTAVDAECYLQAVQLEFGVLLDSDWASYRHCTDSGIAREGLTAHLGREPTVGEVDRLKSTFFRLLEGRLLAEPRQFRAIAGATALLARLCDDGWRVCIVTGGWSTSAKLKRTAAGLPASIPIFSSDLAESREEIVLHAIDQMKARHTVADFDRIVLVGDGVWDLAVAARLVLPFLGVAAGERAHRLQRSGASLVVEDLSDQNLVTKALLSTEVPALSSAEGVA